MTPKEKHEEGKKVGPGPERVEAPAPSLGRGTLQRAPTHVGTAPPGAGDLDRQPELAAELLEPDQTVAAKRARFGRKPLSRWERGLLWALRIYVVAMQIIVVITVIRALHGTGK